MGFDRDFTNNIQFHELMHDHKAVVLLLGNEVVEHANFIKLADHLAHQARFEYKLVFPILLETCQWQNSSLKYIPIYPLNQKPISDWESNETGWQQVLQEIAAVLKPYTSFYPESDRAKALRCICKVAVGTNQSFVSGFLITSNLLLTSNRLINSREKAAKATVSFTDAGDLSASFALAPNRFFLTDAETGISLVYVNETPTQSDYRQARTIEDYHTLKAALDPIKPGDQLDATNFDRAQQLLPNTQTVDFADDEHIQYRGPITSGAPGGPLLNERLEVVAVNPSHREISDYEMLEYNTQTRTVAESSATVQTIAALFRQINQGKTTKDWTDANGHIVLPELFRDLINQSTNSSNERGELVGYYTVPDELFTQETDKPTEVFTTIPKNRTLIALKLTAEQPITPTIEHGLGSMAAVFDRFKPTVEIRFLSENSLEIEKLFFNTLDDFGPVGIERNSKVLKKLTAQLQEKENSFRRKTISTEREQRDSLSELVKQNLKMALEVTHELEISYRTLALFYENAGTENARNVSIVNAGIDQLQDMDSNVFFDVIAVELRQNYDRLDLRNNYSLLVIPGYLGNKQLVNQWAQLSFQHKVMLLTDYHNLENADDILSLSNHDYLTGNDAYLGNVAMTCNYLLGRETFREAGEKALCLPPSCAIAGRLYGQRIQEHANQLIGLSELRFRTTKQEIAYLEDNGLIPLSNSFGHATVSSNRTLYNGENEALLMYPTVRVFDWLTKVFMDFLNRQPLENWDTTLQENITKQVETFLNSITGDEKIIQDFKNIQCVRSTNDKDLFGLVVEVQFHSLTNYYKLQLRGKKIDERNRWIAEFKQ